jgi:hypothetical protein
MLTSPRLLTQVRVVSGSADVAGIITRKDLAHVSDNNKHASRTRAHTLSRTTDDDSDEEAQATDTDQGRPLLPMAAYRLEHDI